MNNSTSLLVICTYKPKAPQHAAALLELARTHYPTLRGLGLVSAYRPTLAQSGDGTIVEIFEWKSEEASRKAHDAPEVKKIWGAMGEICDFVPLSAVAETAKPFAHFRRFEGERQSRPIHFEIPADNIDRCSKFYSDVFGWKVTKWPMGNSTYSLCDTGDPSVTGIDGGIVSRESLKTVMNTQYVEDFEAACKRIEKAGGKATRGMAIPGVGMYAPCYDTEGNLFGILQPEM